MGEIHKLRVKSPYELMKIVDIKIENKPNKHGYLYLKCLIDEEINFDYAIKASTEDEICVYEEIEDTNDEETVNINKVDERKSKRLFYGIVQKVKTTNVNAIYYLEIQALTSSSKLDIKEKSRSFQNVNMTYDDLIAEIVKDYSGFTFDQNVGNGKKISKPLFQFKETDWNFLKRIASELKSELYCDIINLNYMFNFGISHDQSYELDDNMDYAAYKNIKSFYEAGGYNAGYDDTDYFYYEIEGRDIFEIGAKIYYKQKNLYVREYEAYKNKEELFYKYKLSRENGVWQSVIYNKRLKGSTLEGKVLAVQNEQVKLHLDIDENQDEDTAYWFNYAPPSVNIMYSMPLVGETARLYFPNQETENPIVTGCVRKNGNTCEGTADPRNRYFQTENGSEIAMLPNALDIKGGSQKSLSISFNDEVGVQLTSSRGLRLNADGEIVIKTHKRVKINAQSQILMTKGKKSHGVSIESEFHIKANNVIVNGSSRETYDPFPEEENDYSSASFKIVQKDLLAGRSEKQTGWIKGADGTWQYFYSNGEMATGWMKDGNTWYYFDPSGGTMATNAWKQDSKGDWYYLGSDGKMVINRWEQDSKGDWYYLGSDGKMVTDTWEQDSKGNQYHLDADGKMEGSDDSNLKSDYNLIESLSGATPKAANVEDSSVKDRKLLVGASIGTSKLSDNLNSNSKTPAGWIKNANGIWAYVYSSGKIATGWMKENNTWYYFNSDGQMQTGWQEDNKKWYYLGDDGKMQTGLKKTTDGKEYYLYSDGEMAANQWIKNSDGSWHYFDSDGQMQKGWQEYNEKWYYLDDDGKMQTGRKKTADGKEYYLYSDGEMAADQWIKSSDGSWHYFDSDGQMQKGWQEYNGKWYYLDDYGRMQVGWQNIGDTWYNFYSDGDMQTGWIQDSKGLWYYYDESTGKSQTGWINYNNKWYYLNSDHTLKTGWQNIGDTWYHFYSNGELQTGWIQDSKGLWYYYDESTGKSQTGWINYNSKWYYLYADGEIATGWKYLDGNHYYFNSDGEMQTGWIDDEYYLKSNGQMATNQWIQYGDAWYYVDSSGKMAANRWVQYGNTWYHVDSSGEMQTGWTQVGDDWYYFNSSGEMLRATTVDGRYLSDSGKWISYGDEGGSNHQGESEADSAAPSNYVICIGYGGSIGCGIGVTGAGGIAKDGKGNFAALTSIGGEGTTPAIGGGWQFQITNAKSVESLEGWGVSGGGSATVFGVGAGVDYETSTNPDGTQWSGVVISVGANNVFAPLEVHGGMSYTWESELTEEQISNAKSEISSKLKWLNDNLSHEIKEKINNIIGGNIFMIE